MFNKKETVCIVTYVLSRVLTRMVCTLSRWVSFKLRQVNFVFCICCHCSPLYVH